MYSKRRKTHNIFYFEKEKQTRKKKIKKRMKKLYDYNMSIMRAETLKKYANIVAILQSNDKNLL